MTGKLHFKARLRWLGRLARIPGRILLDCGIVATALFRKRPSSFRTIPFDPGDASAEAAARRAIVTAGVSAAPNTYVVAIDRSRGLILVHQLVPTALPPGGGDTEWPL